MKTSTSVNVLYDDTFTVPVETQIQRVYDAGFRHMDMNFWDWCHDPASPFRQDNWRSWVDGIANKAAALGVTFTQSHADVYNFYTGDASRYEMYLRSLEGSAMLGIPWSTFHPSIHPEYQTMSTDKIMQDNVEYFKPLIEKAEKFGVGVALENSAACIYTAEQLCRLAGELASPFAGICWDTGHAHIAGVDQPGEIRRMGSLLKSLHIQDSDGNTDQHTAPHYGTIDWQPIMAALRGIQYSGDFTFEAHNLIRPVPEGCKANALRLLHSIGEELVRNVY